MRELKPREVKQLVQTHPARQSKQKDSHPVVWLQSLLLAWTRSGRLEWNMDLWLLFWGLISLLPSVRMDRHHPPPGQLLPSVTSGVFFPFRKSSVLCIHYSLISSTFLCSFINLSSLTIHIMVSIWCFPLGVTSLSSFTKGDNKNPFLLTFCLPSASFK